MPKKIIHDALSKSRFVTAWKKLPKVLKKILIGIFAGALAGGLIFALPKSNIVVAKYFEQIERLFYDLTFKIKFSYVHSLDLPGKKDEKAIEADSTVEQRIQVIDIDERALAKLGSYFTWPRTHHATVVDYLAQGGASSITFDILFKNADFGERETKNALRVLEKVRPDQDWSNYSPAIRSAYNYDSILVHSIHEAGNVIVSATVSPRKTYQHESQWGPLSTVARQDSIGTSGTLNFNKIPMGAANVWDLLDNIFPELAKANGHVGLVNVVADDDGVHRAEPLFHGFPNPELVPGAQVHYYPLITIQTVIYLFGINPNDIVVKPGEYVDMGKPLGIYKDSLGNLGTTYPNLSWAMVRELLRKRDLILSMGTSPTAPATVEITHQVIVERSVEGELTAEINDAQTLNKSMLRAILATTEFDSLMNLAKKTAVHINDTISLQFDPEAKQVAIHDVIEDESVSLTDYGVEVLREGAKRIAELAPGKRTYLSCNFDLQWSNEKQRIEPSFIVFTPSVLKELLNTSAQNIESIPAGTTRRFGQNVRIPVDDQLRMQVNYTGLSEAKWSKRAFKQISYYELVAHRVDQGSFQGKVFVLGSTAPAMFDFVSTPHQATFPGVLLQATLLQNILNENFLTKLSELNQLWVILGMSILFAIIANLWAWYVGAIVLVLLTMVYLYLGLYFFDNGMYIGMARQILSLLFTYIVITILRYVFESREKRFLDRTFKQYVSPELIEEMKASEEPPVLGGQEIVGTAFFTDIAGFSSFSEAIGSPERLVELLNEYLGVMTDILVKDRGTLDKYIGDAIVAIFGAPVRIADHAQRACIVSLKMQKSLALLREKWHLEGDEWPVLVHKMHMRIGINTGKMVVGNMGSALRKNYTMMGDTVNLAARLESAAKQYGVYIQVSDDTLQCLPPNTVVSRPLDLVVVMGKTEPVLCHELLALQEDTTPELNELVRIWNEAREAFLAMDWITAIQLFEACLPLEPSHPEKDPGSKTCPALVFIKRCMDFQIDPPVAAGETWNGVWVAKSK